MTLKTYWNEAPEWVKYLVVAIFSFFLGAVLA